MDSRKNEIDFLEKEIDVLWEERESLLNIQSHDFEKIASLSFDLRQKNKSRMRLFIEEVEIRKILDEEFSTQTTLEDRISDKMLYKGISREKAIFDIILTVDKENKDIPTHLILSNPATYRRIE